MTMPGYGAPEPELPALRGTERDSAATRLLATARVAYELCADGSGVCYAIPSDRGDVSYRLGGPALEAELLAIYAQGAGKAAPGAAIREVTAALVGFAVQDIRDQVPPLDPRDEQHDHREMSAATELVSLATARYELGSTPDGEAFAVPKDGPRVVRMLRGGGRPSLRAEIARAFYDTAQRTASSSALADAVLVLESMATDAPPVDLALRVDAHEGAPLLDLGTDNGSVVEVTVSGWRLRDPSPRLFRRTRLTLPLPVPASGDADVETLRLLLNVSDEDWPLLLADLVSCLLPSIPHPVLLFAGPQGSAKSTAARLTSSLLDPAAAQLRTAPKEARDWVVAASGSYIVALDNISSIPEWLSDALCRACTGDGWVARALYTDSDLAVLHFRRCMILTAIDPGALRGDLADRLLRIELEAIGESERRTDEEIEATWREVHPVALAGLLDLTVKVLATLPQVRLEKMPRMADFSRVLAAVDIILGTNGLDRYIGQAAELAADVVDSDLVSVAIRDKLPKPWEGSAGDLLRTIGPEKRTKGWPTTPQGMAARLKRLTPALLHVGIDVERGERVHGGIRRWRIEIVGK